MFAGSFEPRDWAFCDGREMNFSAKENRNLLDAIGFLYGEGASGYFLLPNLQSRFPMHFGHGSGLTNRKIGSSGGEESKALNSNSMPSHGHTLDYGNGDPAVYPAANSGAGTSSDPQGRFPAQSGGVDLYSADTPGHMGNPKVGASGSTSDATGQDPAAPFTNRQPYQTINHIIAIKGQAPYSINTKFDRPPFLGEITMMGTDFPPVGWLRCNGAILQIAQHQALFSVIGNRFGGNGSTTFALPDLQGRTPMHPASENELGKKGGVEGNQLDISNLPSHLHAVSGSGEATAKIPAGSDSEDSAAPGPELAMGISSGGNLYSSSATVEMGSHAESVSPEVEATGKSQPIPNIQPTQVLNFVICSNGIFPPRP